MNLPDFMYAEEFGPIIGGFMLITCFMIVFLFMKEVRKMCAYGLYMEASIISSVALWHYYSILYFFLIMGVFALITHPKVWGKIEEKLRFKL